MLIPYLKDITTKLSAPTNINIVEILNNKFVEVDKVDNAHKYKFCFETENNVIPYITDKNVFDATNVLVEPVNYTITCQAIGKYDSVLSPISTQFVYVNKIKLETPTLELDNNSNLNVYFGDYFDTDVDVSIELIYGIDKNGNYMINTTNFKSKSKCNDLRGTITGYFDLKEFLSVGEEYKLFVRATTDNPNYSTSDPSDSIKIRI